MLRRSVRGARPVERESIWMFMLLVFCAAMGTACKTQSTHQELVITEARVRPAPKGQISAAYLKIRNYTTATDALQGVQCKCASAVEIHRTLRKKFTIEMVRLASLPIPAGSTVVLASGGDHVMLIGLKEELKAGTQITLGLQFARAGLIQVPARVMQQ